MTVAKYLAVLVALANLRSTPFAWHTRVWWPVIVLQARFQLFRLSILFKSKKEKKEATYKWVESLAPVGSNPFTRQYIYKTWADFSDSDYNMHLSNSSYPKNLDCARMRSALDFFPGYMTAGGGIALGATHFQFLKEIPILSPYEIRMSLVAWDQKWIFLIARYVTHPAKKLKKSRAAERGHPTDGAPIPDISTPASGVDTPAPGSATPVPGYDGAETAAVKAVAANVPQVEADGALVNCISVNQLVFKHGRITVPPSLVLAYDGFCMPAGTTVFEEKFSPASPPPHWKHVQELRRKGLKAERDFLRGGWKLVPEGERWWEQALEGGEELRKVNLDRVKGVREGIEGGRVIATDLFSL
ncbi:hypothetical protein PENSPDRAFT_677052 [Peniophora sp. CONT]|nr:hypothetical protein PENSPDRAFT_677052 [Peniophora sp. CONT]